MKHLLIIAMAIILVQCGGTAERGEDKGQNMNGIWLLESIKGQIDIVQYQRERSFQRFVERFQLAGGTYFRTVQQHPQLWVDIFISQIRHIAEKRYCKVQFADLMLRFFR